MVDSDGTSASISAAVASTQQQQQQPPPSSVVEVPDRIPIATGTSTSASSAGFEGKSAVTTATVTNDKSTCEIDANTENCNDAAVAEVGEEDSRQFRSSSFENSSKINNHTNNNNTNNKIDDLNAYNGHMSELYQHSVLESSSINNCDSYIDDGHLINDINMNEHQQSVNSIADSFKTIPQVEKSSSDNFWHRQSLNFSPDLAQPTVASICEWYSKKALAHERIDLLCRLNELSEAFEIDFQQSYGNKIITNEHNYMNKVLLFI